MIGAGFAGVFVRLYNEIGELITDKIPKFRYVHSEDLEDNCELTIKFTNPILVDHPNLQEHQKVILVWGYTNNKEQAQKRILYIYDSRNEFTATGVNITLYLFSRTGYLQFADRKGAWNASLKTVVKTLAESAGVEYGGYKYSGPEDFAEVRQAINFVQTGTKRGEKEVIINTDGSVSFGSNLVGIDNTAVVKTYPMVQPGSDRKAMNDIMEITGEPDTVLTGHDDTVTIIKRDWSQEPIATYSYKKEPGNLLKFVISTHNKELKKDATAAIVTASNALNKEVLRTEIDSTNNPESPVLGDIMEVRREKIERMGNNLFNNFKGKFGFNSVMLLGLRKKVTTTSTYRPGGVGVPITKTMVTYEEVKILNRNDTYVLSMKIAGTTGDLKELDQDMFVYPRDPDELYIPGRGILKLHGLPGSGTLTPQQIDDLGGDVVLGYESNFQVLPQLPLEGDYEGVERPSVIDRLFPIDIRAEIISAEEDIQTAAGRALRSHIESKLKLNECILDVIGDPLLVSGRIVSVLNVGTKWAGNYYVAKVTHEMGEGTGYICKLDLYKNSINTVEGLPSNQMLAADLGIPSNKQLTSKDGSEQLVKVPVIKD